MLSVLTGTPPDLAAARAAIPATHLTTAADRYRAAGQGTLAAPAADGWYQVNVAFPDPRTAEHATATRLAPRLRHAEIAGLLTCWWYIRKTPHWRLRLHAAPHHHQHLQRFLTTTLTDLTTHGPITTWSATIYEPETLAFGGPDGMDVAHAFFHADSSHTLTYLDPATSPPIPLGAREVSLLLCTALLRAAGQDWHEQGDVWHRITQLRPLDLDLPDDQLRTITGKVHRLLALDTNRLPGPADGTGTLDPLRSWLAAATTAGQALRDLAHGGVLRRGLRDVLAHHVVFHWNRLGLSTAAQAVLAHTATTTILNTHTDPDHVA